MLITLMTALSIIGNTTVSLADTMMLKEPAISKSHIAFTYGGDIWITDRNGQNPRRLTSRPAREVAPKFSPDGKTIAFTAGYNGNADVYTIPVEGGEPKRLTWHPENDIVNGWSPDGKKVLFTSRREMTSGLSAQAWQISKAGGYPEKIMDAVVQAAAWNAKGTQLAYQPYATAHTGASSWHNHRGGRTPPIWIINPSSGALEKVPHVRASDTNPMWVNGNVYFLSDRSGINNIWRYDTDTKSIEQITHETVWNIETANAANGEIIYATTSGIIKHLDVKRSHTTQVSITINSDTPQAHPQWKSIMSNVTDMGLSPSGKNALLTARGEVFTVPLHGGTARNITNTSGSKESGAIWSPKGDQIAYISDETQKLQLIITDQDGKKVKAYPLGDAYYFLSAWTGDGSKIIYGDSYLNTFSINLSSGAITKIFTDNQRNNLSISLTQDGKWMAYTKAGKNLFNDIYLYNFETNKHTRVTDGMSNTASPAFSSDGKYLYFAASTNAGPTQVGLDMSSQERPRRFGLYAVVLSANGKSPFLHKKSSEPAGEDNSQNDQPEATKNDVSTIETDGISNRIIALPVPKRFYFNLAVAHDGALFFMEGSQPGGSIEPNGQDFSATLKRFDFEAGKAETAMQDIQGFAFSQDGKTIIVMTPGHVMRTGKVEKNITTAHINTWDIKAFINPREEWNQIFNEVWRLEKQYFYAENMHNIDWDGIYKKYQPLVKHIATRTELNRILVEMIAELQVSHNSVGGGDIYYEAHIPVGVLGADLRIENEKYRITKIYTGEKWNPFLKAPLAALGIGVHEGDYIHAINGQPLSAADNIYSYLTNTVGKQITLSVSSDGNMKNSHDVIIEPIESEQSLRHWAWVEGNRKTVNKMTDGKVGYIYLPNTESAGFTYFNRMFFAQTDKEALIIDERQNGGGQAANYITDILSRKYLASWKDRAGELYDTPGGAIYGPKVMLIDQDAGSGGDFLPYSFKRLGLGKLIGKTTWGGLIGSFATPRLIDGGYLSVPHFRFFTPDNEWRIENEGITPDIDVELDPAAVNKGRDTQLERAVEEMLKELKTYKPVRLKKAPPFPTEAGQ